jgi:hypothetical protein
LLVRFLILFLTCSSVASSAENLAPTDYEGEWVQSHPITKGETSILVISSNKSVHFSRSFTTGYPDQVFETEPRGIRFDDDIAIVELHWEDGALAYKLVMSGWRVGGHRQIFGTMFMYRDGKLFNGLPFGFKIEG